MCGEGNKNGLPASVGEMRRLFPLSALTGTVSREALDWPQNGTQRCGGGAAAALVSHKASLHHSLPRFSDWTRARFAPKVTHPYRCGDCGKTFRLLNALNHHILTKHAGKATAMMVDADGTLGNVSSTSADHNVNTSAAAATPMSRKANEAQPPSQTTADVRSTSPSFSSSAENEGEESPSLPTSADREDGKAHVFVCTICQKTFRLEAALQHHYQAKHNTQMPLAGVNVYSGTAGASQTLPPGTSPGSGSLSSGEGGGGVPATATQYVQQQESVLPDAPAYHLGVAPHAPEEGDLAVSWRCVNSCVLVGTVTECTQGYVFEDHVLQLTVVTRFDAPSAGDPDMDFHTVRVYDESHWASLVSSLKVGDHVMVNGRLRMVPQFDAGLRRYYHYPLVQVTPGSGLVTKLS